MNQHTSNTRPSNAPIRDAAGNDTIRTMEWQTAEGIFVRLRHKNDGTGHYPGFSLTTTDRPEDITEGEWDLRWCGGSNAASLDALRHACRDRWTTDAGQLEELADWPQQDVPTPGGIELRREWR